MYSWMHQVILVLQTLDLPNSFKVKLIRLIHSVERQNTWHQRFWTWKVTASQSIGGHWEYFFTRWRQEGLHLWIRVIISWESWLEPAELCSLILWSITFTWVIILRTSSQNCSIEIQQQDLEASKMLLNSKPIHFSTVLTGMLLWTEKLKHNINQQLMKKVKKIN